MYLTRLLSFISLLLFSTLLFAQKSTFLECKTSLSLMENSVPKEGKLNINNNREFFKNQPTIGYLASIGLRHENIDKSRLTISYGLQY